MDNQTVWGIVTIIGSVSGAICSIIAAYYAGRAKTTTKETNANVQALRDDASTVTTKMDAVEARTATIEQQTNGNLSEMREKIRHQAQVNDYLITVIASLVDQLPEGSLTKAKREFDKLRTELGHRRHGDPGFTANFSKDHLRDQDVN